MIQLTRSTELIELQQRVAKAQEWQHKCNAQLEEFQDIGAYLDIKALVMLQVVQDGKNTLNTKLVEHPVKQDLLRCQDEAKKVHA